jgi:hypothetical protein
VPPQTVALAGIQWEQVRNRPVYRSLPLAWAASLEPFRQARVAWVAYNGKDLLVIAGGAFSTTPSGTMPLTPHLVVAGPAGVVRAAATQYSTHRPGAPQLVDEAAPVMHSAIWAVVRGDAHLPLPGNLANLNRLLHFTDHVTAAIQGDSPLQIDLTGYCPGPGRAQHLEESVRALVTLSAAATHDAALAALLQSTKLARDGSVVRIHFEANPSAFGQLGR